MGGGKETVCAAHSVSILFVSSPIAHVSLALCHVVVA
jgi:hypothetical protein